ncbi:MAG: FAD-binding protein [Chloroflexota bacterium]
MLFWNNLADRDTPSRQQQIAALCHELQLQIGHGGRVSDAPSERELYSRDLGDIPKWLEKALFRTTPFLVVQPKTADEIATTLTFASKNKMAVVPRGIASTAFGGPTPTRNGIVLDLSPMDGILEVSTEPYPTVTVEAGARFGKLQEQLESQGYTLPVYPSNRLGTVAGWLSSGGFGVNGLKYGHVGRWVEAIEVATMDGRIRSLSKNDEDFDLFIGSEGQLGVITRATLRILPLSPVRAPHLLSFDSAEAAFDFALELDKKGVRPATITYISTELLQSLNLLHRWDHVDVQGDGQNYEPNRYQPYLPERPSLLVYVDDAETESSLQAVLRDHPEIAQADRSKAGHMWSERFFPMKIRRLGPSLLAGQVVLPAEKAAAFLKDASDTAKKWGIDLAVEAHLLSTDLGPSSSGGHSSRLHALTIPMFLTDRKQLSYLAHTVFVSLLDRLGSRWHGQPYNLGIWHAPFANEKLSKERVQRLLDAKRLLDPQDLLNPGKFPTVRSRFMGLTGLLFQPRLFKIGMDFVSLLTPAMGVLTKNSTKGGAGIRVSPPAQMEFDPRFHVSPHPLDFDTVPLEQLSLTADQCTSCGNCISVCPAYLHTKDERTTARAKLWLARRLVEGKAVDPEEAQQAFLCMRCRACAEVCQTQLPLMLGWEQLEYLLAERFGRPEEAIRRFLVEIERNRSYYRMVGLKRPGDLLVQNWLNGQESSGNGHQTIGGRESSGGVGNGRHAASLEEPLPEAVPAPIHGGKFHIDTSPALPKENGFGKFKIQRNDFCVNCGHCGEACIYGVHFRNPADLRRMAAPSDYQCKACYRCIEECPRQALSISIHPEFGRLGYGPYTPDVVWSLARQADEGRIPVTGAGYRGPFAGEGFDEMWTDMSEIVRPTRDGIHGREYISTAIDVGRRPLRLAFDESGRMISAPPNWVEIPIPILFGSLPIHADEPRVRLAIRRAARVLHTFVLEPDPSFTEQVVQIDDTEDVFDAVKRLKEGKPTRVVVVKVSLGGSAPARVEELVQAGIESIHVSAGWDGRCHDGTTLYESLPLVHNRLVSANLRDAVTLLASGGISAAEHVPKAVILGADGVVIDLPLLAALGCSISQDCFEEVKSCSAALADLDVLWGQQRIVNLMASWRNQLLEVLGAMGMREVRRLRGERGRSMLASKLEAELFAPLFNDRGNVL